MKKAIFAGIVALLALAVVSCPEIQTDSDGNPKIVYDDNGEPWGVKLTISTETTGRALTGPLAELYVTYYEVAFADEKGDIYRTSWSISDVGTIEVPFAIYDTVNPAGLAAGHGAAILFAGWRNSNTLLAVGKLATVNGAASTTIDANTVRVAFTLTPLATDVKADPASTFQITVGPDTASLTAAFTGDGYETSSADSVTAGTYTSLSVGDSSIYSIGQKIKIGTVEIKVTDIPDTTTLTIPSTTLPAGSILRWLKGDFPTVIYKNKPIPLFIVKPDSTPNKATFTITGPTTSSFPTTFPHAEGVFVGSPTLVSKPELSPDLATGGFKLATTSTIDAKESGKNHIVLTGKIGFSLDVPEQTLGSPTSGLSSLQFDIPVRAMATEAVDASGRLWHIVGGLHPEELDLGAASNDLGGAILLGTESALSGGIIINVQ